MAYNDLSDFYPINGDNYLGRFPGDYLVCFSEEEIYRDKKKRFTSIYGKEFTRLKTHLWSCEFVDIPDDLVKSIDFISEYKLEISFYETVEFCVEKYFQTNFDYLKGKKLIIKYLNKEGKVVRTDSYNVERLSDIKRSKLSNEVSDMVISIVFECSNHDISTCKE